MSTLTKKWKKYIKNSILSAWEYIKYKVKKDKNVYFLGLSLVICDDFINTLILNQS